MNPIIDHLSSIEGIAKFPVIAFIIFFVVFMVILIHTLSIKKKDIDEMKRMPLEEDDRDNYQE